MNGSHKLPKKYWVFFSIMIFFIILMFVNIFVCVYFTDSKEISDFSTSEIKIFIIFLLSELLCLIPMFFFAFKCGNMVREKTMLQRNNWYDAMYLGIKPGDYDFVWFDYDDEQRALVLKNGETYNLYVEKYNDKMETWEAVNTVSYYDSLDNLKKSLYTDFEFYSAETADFDEYGEFEPKENIDNNNLNTFEISDLWLLLSIGFSKKGSDICYLIKYGDYLNHSVFSLDELNYGLSKLIFNGYVKKNKDKFITTNKAKSFYKSYKKYFENPTDEFLRMTYIFQYEPKKLGCKLIEYISEQEYKETLNNYREIQ